MFEHGLIFKTCLQTLIVGIGRLLPFSVHVFYSDEAMEVVQLLCHLTVELLQWWVMLLTAYVDAAKTKTHCSGMGPLNHSKR